MFVGSVSKDLQDLEYCSLLCVPVCEAAMYSNWIMVPVSRRCGALVSELVFSEDRLGQSFCGQVSKDEEAFSGGR